MADDTIKALDMSLDDYIEKLHIVAPKVNGSKSRNNENKSGCNRLEEDEYMLDDDIESTAVWNGPDANTNYIDLDIPDNDELDAFDSVDLIGKEKRTADFQHNKKEGEEEEQEQEHKPIFDLRNKISRNNGTMLDMNPDIKSQQWRLMEPNVVNQRPPGMPPLVPNNTETRGRRQNNYGRNRRNRNRYLNRNQFYKNNYSRNGNNGGNGNGYCNTNGNNNNFNNGQGQRFNQRNNNQEMLNKNIKLVVDGLNRSTGQALPHVASDMTIQCSINPVTKLSNRRPTVNLQSDRDVPMNTVGTNNSSNNNNNSNESLRSLLGFNGNNAFSMEMMPSLASKFLDFFQNINNTTTHKPIYDMKVQKEIHNIQKKPLMYKCPGGEVVSSDGAGINCDITPSTSGISLNHRFA